MVLVIFEMLMDGRAEDTVRFVFFCVVRGCVMTLCGCGRGTSARLNAAYLRLDNCCAWVRLLCMVNERRNDK